MKRIAFFIFLCLISIGKIYAQYQGSDTYQVYENGQLVTKYYYYDANDVDKLLAIQEANPQSNLNWSGNDYVNWNGCDWKADENYIKHLIYLDLVYYYELITIDVSGCTNLQTLDCHYNQLTSLNVSSCSDLQALECCYNQLTSLNVSGLTNLKTLDCHYNQLTSLNVSELTKLYWLTCYSTQLMSLDASGCLNLRRLDCYINQLTSLSVSGCTNLQTLNCLSNQLTSLNVSGLANLQDLYCNGNQFTSLNVSGLTNLQTLSCDDNQLTSLNVSDLTNLQYLYCNGNQLTSLNVSGCTNLAYLYCDYNQLTSLDVSSCSRLSTLSCDNNSLSLANLYELSQKINNPDNLWLGNQTLSDTIVIFDSPIPIDTVFYGVNTVFEVNAPATDYQINNGEITFLNHNGNNPYQVKMSNPAIISNDKSPASVTQTFYPTLCVGIPDILHKESLQAYMQNGTLHVSGLTAGKSWSVCDASGAIVYQSIARNDTETWHAASLSHGIYIVQSGKETIKVVY